MVESIVETDVAPLGGSGVGVDAGVVVRVLGGKRVLDGVDLHVSARGRVGIVGRSGAGKSTLLSLVAGLDDPDVGAVSVGGETSPAGRLARCALMPQRDCLLPWRSALDNAGLALENAGLSRREASRRAAPLFERLGLAGCERLLPAQLSGGMRQRVLVLAGGRIAAELEVDVQRDGPRRAVVTSPAFVELREQALEAIE